MSSVKFALRGPCVALSLGLLGAATVTPAHATIIFSGGDDLDATITVLDLLTAQVGPVNALGHSAPPTYNISQSVASLTAIAGLSVANLGITTGILNVSAASPFMPTPTGTATASVNNLNLGLNTILLLHELGISATTISSTSSVSGVGGPLSAAGSTTIEDLNVGGLAAGLGFSASGTITPPANDVILNLLGLEVILNAQQPLGNGITTDGIVTTAILVDFNNFVLGTGILNGDIAIAQSEAEISNTTPMPEPSAWVEMMLGFGLIGAVARGRAKIRRAAA